MSGLPNKFRRDEAGVAAVELGLVTPVFLLLFLSSIELGHMIYYSITIEKGLRSAVTYAGRMLEHDATIIQNTKNIVMTGNPTGTKPYLVPGWNDPDASVVFTVTPFTKVGAGGVTAEVSVVSVTAKVPYVPVVGMLIPALETLMKDSASKGKVFITLTHQQALIGN